jgi:hypothetical protein
MLPWWEGCHFTRSLPRRQRGREGIWNDGVTRKFISTQLKQQKQNGGLGMKKALIAILLGAALTPVAVATAQDSSPYVVGHWNLNDSFQDFTPGASITTDNTDFTFLNPTDLTLTLEYAFFAAPDGKFCGCDRDTLKPNGALATLC